MPPAPKILTTLASVRSSPSSGDDWDAEAASGGGVTGRRLPEHGRERKPCNTRKRRAGAIARDAGRRAGIAYFRSLACSTRNKA